MQNAWSAGSDEDVAAGRDTAVFTWLQASAGWSWALKEAVRAESSEREEKLENQHGGPARMQKCGFVLEPMNMVLRFPHPSGQHQIKELMLCLLPN